MVISIAFAAFKIGVFNSCYNIFSKSYVCADVKAFITVTAGYIACFINNPVSICRISCIATGEDGRVEVGFARTVAVISVYTPAVRLRCFSSALGQAYEVAAVIAVNNIAVTIEVGAFEG